MRTVKKITAVLAAVLITLNSFPGFAFAADDPLDGTVVLDEEEQPEPAQGVEDKEEQPEPVQGLEEEGERPEPTQASEGEGEQPEPVQGLEEEGERPEPAQASEEEEEQPDITQNPKDYEDKEDSGDSEDNGEESDIPVTDEPPAFSVRVENSFQGYIVSGNFKEFPSDTTRVQLMYSLDGKNYQASERFWDVNWLDYLHADKLSNLLDVKNQIYLYSKYEPLKSYLAGELDCFYLKLCVTRENGITYETQEAVVDRGNPQPVPEDAALSAMFDSSMSVRETNPFRYIGQYQLTVSENTTAEEIASFLPDTLPIEIQFYSKQLNLNTEGIVDCPVTWKPLALPQLIAGESITLADAAEEIAVPSGTLVNTPQGIFRLDEPLVMDNPVITDEVRLVLNVVSEGENPTGVLSAENYGLEMSFYLKPTGAAAIHAYTYVEGDSEWAEIPGLPLLDAVNGQPATKNSKYALVLDNTMEPYRSYLEAEKTGGSPIPFFVGLKIEGGVYDGRQLVLAWPGTYEIPPKLPEVGGSGGNENNAGADNKDDSTASGQRPGLPPDSENKPEATEAPGDNIDAANKEDNTVGGLPQISWQKPEDTENNQKPIPSDSGDKTEKPKNTGNSQQPVISPNPGNKPENPEDTGSSQTPPALQNPEEKPVVPEVPGNKENGRWKVSLQNLIDKLRIPVSADTPEDDSNNQDKWNLWNENIIDRYPPFVQSSIKAQTLAKKNNESRYPDPAVNEQNGTLSKSKTPKTFQLRKNDSNISAFNNLEKKTGISEKPDRAADTEASRQASLLSVAAMAAAGICIAGIYLSISSGRIPRRIRNKLHGFLLHK
ncbi:hypothetical protein D7V86_09215 [bacterium D16-51]|nr:hypothetical protein D7V96_09795 [bacterium D16-59]RKI60374.1 hypothetical protein D7V86_09215 [bacterium D16-51]